ncbi:hypothetical protein [Bacillus paramycoides]|uniref:hypothetical protein n=1 Tax=Bacillus paramycoides TaxID=2026194 RepID=UPI002E2392EC|nr:hypothetical protein [Bacillus paramycoides]
MKFIAVIIVSVIALGLLINTVFPPIALYLGLITGEQYVEITTKFYEFGFQFLQNGASIIPSIIPTR